MLNSQCSNPMDRLCDLLLGWRIVDDIYPAQRNEREVKTPHPIPSIFHDDYLHYLEIFEPLVLEEMKASVISKILGYGGKDAMRGTMDIKTAKVPHFTSVHSICYSNFRKSPSCEGKCREPAVMDLIIITKDEVDRPSNLSPSRPPSSYALALVTSLHNTDGSRGMQLLTNMEGWEHFWAWLDCLSAISAASSPDSRNSNSAAVFTNTVASLPGKSKTAIFKHKTSEWHSVHYMVLESLTSFWREYSALHQLKSVRLRRDILLGTSSSSLSEYPDSCPTQLTDSSVVASTADTTTSTCGGVGLSSTVPFSHVSSSSSSSTTTAAIVVPQFSNSEGENAHTKQLTSPPQPPPKSIKPTSSFLNTTMRPLLCDNADNKVRKKLRITNKKVDSISSLMDNLRPTYFPELPLFFGFTPTFVKVLNNNFNESQKEAIHRVTSVEKGFVLVQGPPGTGKTHTVMGMLNALHIREYDNFYTMAIKDILGKPGLRCRESQSISVWMEFIASLSKYKPHILVTAPSNVAVDNVIQRIMEKGFVDGNGGQYFPTIIRLGSGGGKKNTKINCVTLEETVEQIYNQPEETSEGEMMANNVEISILIKEICRLQTYLLCLRKAFFDFPLPIGWEIRIDMANCTVYWVDHIHQATSVLPPPLDVDIKPEMCSRLTRYYSVETLPEYTIHTHALSETLDRLCLLNIQVKRMKALAMKGSMNGFSNSELRNHVEASVIDEAHLVFSTLNSTGHGSFDSTSFNVLVVDEATQSTEMSSLIPLRLGCKKCVLVGDPRQLPGTIFSPKLSKNSGTKYDRSLFERLTDSGQSSILLNTQYRMLPEISAFPSINFYGGLLLDADVSWSRPAYIRYRNLAEGHAGSKMENASLFTPFLFFDLLTSEDSVQQKLSTSSSRDHNTIKTAEMGGSSGTVSRSNREEALCCVLLLKALSHEANRCGTKLGSIGIITPYQEQLVELNDCLRKAQMISAVNAGSEESCVFDIETNTVDGFQGREKDVIIISCVRANDVGSIGFLSDVRRMNVALTRSRFGLYMIGSASTLSADVNWDRLIEHADRTDSLVMLPSSSCDLLSLLETHFST